VEPEGILSEPLELLRILIASCPSFQAWVGADTEADALGSIFVIDQDDPETIIRPRAIVDWGEKGQWKIEAGGARHFFTSRHELWLLFEADVSEDAAPIYRDATYEFTNPVGAILQEMMERSGAGGRLGITEIERTGPPKRSNEEEDEDFFSAIFEIVYGF